MTFKTHEITVDLVNATPTKELRFSQGDRNSAKFVLNITNEGQELDLSKAKAVRITFKKSDGTTVFQQDCQVINALKGKYQIVLKTQTLAAVGNVYAQVRIFEDDRELDAEPFVFTVKQSYSGDTVVESTNEFTIIQKAIEAGKKLEGVDIDGIIAAGAKADAALPKTGGTMTGPLVMNGSKVTWKNTASTGEIDMAVASDGVFWITDKKTGRTIATIKEGVLNVPSETNLLKKAGDTMTGDLAMNNERNLVFKGSNDYEFKLRAQLNNNKMVMQSTHPTGNKFIWDYWADTDTFSITSNTNLVKKTGDTMTGSLNFDVKAGASKALRGIIDGQVQSGLLLEQSGFQAFDWKNNKQVFQYLEATNTFNVTATNTNLVTKAKDDRAIIPVTADAELITSYGVISDRRGNTVTLRAPIRRKVGSTNGHVFTLPPGMRPTMMLTQVVHASDGTPALMTIPSDTGQVLLQTITPAIMGKDYHIVLTYVVD
ncbi:BppU family phage baseplate upper protein [Bacillus sp. SH5-2]|uniref:BppU family phage baseplate upper protein n=1 Tax=Bacillus sp. SH5-2 TaxID=2217834 RepID=UPI0011EC8428|nr:BppU family phage baseplate upper protein [Bacillus sp. SH5-2]KAA0763005.1 DUF2479 domain-containing protein [Bacillus sp. SH5-2]